LSLAQAIVTRNNGEIEVISEKGQGTTIILRLPVAHEPPATKPEPLEKGIKNIRFLIITDEDIVRELLSQLLKSKGGETTVAFSASEGIKLVGRNAFHMVIADLNTPDVQTSTMTKKLRALAKSMPVILVDARGEQSPSQALKKFGADLMISRPLNMDQVLPLISGVLLKYGFSQ
jgi:DNA-binding NtrC family response regulator